MSRVSWIILMAVVLGMGSDVGRQYACADTLIDVPAPPRPRETGSVVLDIVAEAMVQARSSAVGQHALLQYSTRRSVPTNVYTSNSPTRSAWSQQADDYARAWYISNGPRIWGTWWPYGGWGGCTMWTIGWPQQQGGMGPGCVGGGMTFAVLGGGSVAP